MPHRRPAERESRPDPVPASRVRVAPRWYRDWRAAQQWCLDELTWSDRAGNGSLGSGHIGTGRIGQLRESARRQLTARGSRDTAGQRDPELRQVPGPRQSFAHQRGPERGRTPAPQRRPDWKPKSEQLGQQRRGTGAWPAPSRSATSQRARRASGAARPQPTTPAIVRRAHGSAPHRHRLNASDETTRTEQLVDELRESSATGAPPPPLRTLMLLGTLCGVLLLSATAGLVALSSAAPSPVVAPPVRAPLLGARSPHPAVLDGPDAAAPDRAAHPASRLAALMPPHGSAAHEPAALAAVRSYYRELSADPASAIARLTHETQPPGLPGIAATWPAAELIRPLLLRPLGPREVLGEVEVRCADGSRLVLRHRISVTGGSDPVVTATALRSVQRFPR